MPNDVPERPETRDAGQGKQLGPDAARAEEREPTQEELDEREERFPLKRKPMGPTEEEPEEEGREAEDQPPDVPPTSPS